MVMPPVPKDLLPDKPVFKAPLAKAPAFGHECRQLFRFREGWVNLNHGSYGSTPNVVFDAFVEWNRICEESPDLFFKWRYQPAQNNIRSLVAKILKSETDNIVLVPNTTIGMNCVIRSLTYKPNDTIICFNTAYDAVERLLAWAKDAHDGLVIDVLELEYPVSDDQVLRLLRERILKLISEGRNIKLCVTDAISSVPGVRIPWERIVALVKEYSILSLVDGAHAIGQIPVDLKTAQPDFFCTNAHKWLFAHRAAAVLYIDKKHQGYIQASPTNMSYLSRGTKFNPSSSFSTANEFVSAFEWQGTQDLSSNLSIDVALAFREWLGGEEAIMKYNHDLATTGGRKCAEMLGTEIMEVTDPACQTNLITSMVNVRLPISPAIVKSETSQKLRYTLLEKYNTFVSPFVHAGSFWVRISAQIYLDLTDFEYAGRVLKEICEDIENAR